VRYLPSLVEVPSLSGVMKARGETDRGTRFACPNKHKYSIIKSSYIMLPHASARLGLSPERAP
jgi:hypothetical protein